MGEHDTPQNGKIIIMSCPNSTGLNRVSPEILFVSVVNVKGIVRGIRKYYGWMHLSIIYFRCHPCTRMFSFFCGVGRFVMRHASAHLSNNATRPLHVHVTLVLFCVYVGSPFFAYSLFSDL